MIKNLLMDILVASAVLCGISAVYDFICDITKFNSPDFIGCMVIGAGTYIITKFLRN